MQGRNLVYFTNFEFLGKKVAFLLDDALTP